MIRPPLARSDLPGLYARACAYLSSGVDGAIVVELGAIAADAVALDALARLSLAARRRGAYVRLQGGSPELRQLIELSGLDQVFARSGGPTEVAGA